MPYSLDPDDIQAIRQAYGDAVSRPRPGRGGGGCLVAITAVALFLGLPAVLDWLGVTLPQSIGVALEAILLAAALAGAAVAVLGGGQAAAATRDRAEAALAALSRPFGALDREERRRAVVELLANAYVRSDATVVAAFDLHTARRRVGDSLPYVLAAEEALLRKPGIRPVFTAEEDDEG